MLKRLKRHVPRGQFAHRLAWLSGGTLLGQAMLVLVSPLLTRLFTPEDFGLLAVFQALAATFAGIMALRYEYLVPICKTDEDALGVMVLSMATVGLLTTVAVVSVWFGSDRLASLIGDAEIGTYLWLLPLALLVSGMGQPFEYYSIRQGTFRTNGTTRIVQYGGQALPQVVFGLAGLGAVGLIVGYVIGYVGRLLVYLVMLPRGVWIGLWRVRWRQVVSLAGEGWRYPVFSSPSTLLQSASQMLPAILLAVLYGPAIAGLFGLAQRIMVMPVRLLSQAASQVFLGQAAPLESEGIHRLFTKTALRFLLLGAAGMMPILLFGPYLFALVFGEAWRLAGIMAQVLVPLQLARFVVMPISQTLNLFRRQEMELLSSILGGIVLGGSFGLGWALGLEPLATLLLYSLGSGVVQLFLFLVALRIVRHHTRAMRQGRSHAASAGFDR